MPVSIVRRYAIPVVIAATVLVLVILVMPRVIAAATPALASQAGAPVVGPSAAEGARLDAVRLDMAVGGSEARYRGQEVLSGRGFNEAVGRTSNVQGSILL